MGEGRGVEVDVDGGGEGVEVDVDGGGEGCGGRCRWERGGVWR